MTKLKNVLTHKFWGKFWLLNLTIIVILILLLPYIPSNEVTQLLEYTIFLSPRWFFLFLLLPVFLFWNDLSKYHRILFSIYTIVFINFQDANLNIPSNSQIKSSVKLLSLNMGGGSGSKYLNTIIKRENPDVFLFQETSVQNINKIFTTPWQFQCDAGLCIASKYPYKKVGELSRRIFKGWGNFAVYYELNVDGKKLPLMNLHLETPRPILSNLIGKTIVWGDIKKFRENKSLEASLITTWADNQSNFIMLGDFNMTTNESMYKEYFSSYQNALDTVGLGFNYTKYTLWHGVRIDHVLTSDNVNLEAAQVIPSLGGDHRGILVTINLP